MTARERLEMFLAPEVLAALEELVVEQVDQKLEAATNGHGSPWLSLDAAAEYTSLSRRTLEREIAKGRLRSPAIGRRRLFHRDELDTFLRATGEE